MNRFRYEAFLKDFPFLREILGLPEINKLDYASVTSMKVKRIDEHLLNRRLNECESSALSFWQRLWVIMPDGSVKKVPVRANIANSVQGESIIEAMVGFEEVTHLIFLELEDYVWDPETVQYAFQVVVYRASRETSIAGEIEKARRIALAQIRQEADF